MTALYRSPEVTGVTLCSMKLGKMTIDPRGALLKMCSWS